MKHNSMRSSLRKKITLAFLALALINSVFVVMAFIDLRFLQHRIQEGLVTADFEYAIQEMRRHEKNLFLYGDNAELTETEDQSALALEMLRNQHSTLQRISNAQQMNELEHRLQDYHTALNVYREHTVNRSVLEKDIRAHGHAILSLANNLIHAERLAQARAIERAQHMLMISTSLLVVMFFVIASILVRVVITPLRRMTRDMDAIAMGRFDKLKQHSNDKELLAFSNAFNHMLEELDARQRHLLHSEKLASLGVLSAGIAHEINNPLSNISSSCQLMLEDLHSASHEQLTEWASMIDSETQRARNIVKTLLNFGQHQELSFKNIALLDLVQQTLVLMRGAIRQYQANIEIDIAVTLQLNADPQRLQQILINLLRNALETQTQNITIKISAKTLMRQHHFTSHTLVAGNVEHFAKSASPAVHFLIEDNGPGIDSADYPKIFDPFYTTHEPGNGMGLGLYIVQEIIQEHDGIIAIFSEPGHGTRVLLQLPTLTAAAI